MKLISFNDIKRLDIPPKTCYEWVCETIKRKSDAILPPKISLHPEDGVFCNFMPCILSVDGDRKIGGIKIVNRYPKREPSLDSQLILMNADSGDFLALMDANWITAMRTGAVAAHSVQLFAKKDFQKVSLIGLGNTARATLLVLASIFPEKEFDIKLLRYKEQEFLFTERFKTYPNLHFTCVDTPALAVKGSDVIISCATYFADDLCNDRCFDEGVLVVPVHTRGFTNCDLFFDKVYADDYGHVCHFKNFDRFRSFSEVSDVVNGKEAGRTSERDRILVYNIGLAVHDMFFAYKIYQMLLNDSNLQELKINAPKEKFWV